MYCWNVLDVVCVMVNDKFFRNIMKFFNNMSCGCKLSEIPYIIISNGGSVL